MNKCTNERTREPANACMDGYVSKRPCGDFLPLSSSRWGVAASRWLSLLSGRVAVSRERVSTRLHFWKINEQLTWQGGEFEMPRVNNNNNNKKSLSVRERKEQGKAGDLGLLAGSG